MMIQLRDSRLLVLLGLMLSVCICEHHRVVHSASMPEFSMKQIWTPNDFMTYYQHLFFENQTIEDLSEQIQASVSEMREQSEQLENLMQNEEKLESSYSSYEEKKEQQEEKKEQQKKGEQQQKKGEQKQSEKQKREQQKTKIQKNADNKTTKQTEQQKQQQNRIQNRIQNRKAIDQIQQNDIQKEMRANCECAPITLKQIATKLYQQLIDDFARFIIPVLNQFYQIYKSKPHREVNKKNKIFYANNFASISGGARIVMKSSNKIKSINSILDDSHDNYMYTNEALPIKIIIGLSEEVALESIIIDSEQMYSCITKQFKVEGKFTLEDSKWVALGRFWAENQFGQQEFFTEKKIVRYIQITFLSAFGKWSYFTLTQVKIRGKGLFADALTQITRNNIKQEVHEVDEGESESVNEEEEMGNFCQVEFKAPSELPHDINLISSLINKIDNLENKNIGQSKFIETLENRLNELSKIAIVKNNESEYYQNLANRYRSEVQISFYMIMISGALSVLTLCSLVCLCINRRNELTKYRRNDEGK